MIFKYKEQFGSLVMSPFFPKLHQKAHLPKIEYRKPYKRINVIVIDKLEKSQAKYEPVKNKITCGL